MKRYIFPLPLVIILTSFLAPAARPQASEAPPVSYVVDMTRAEQGELVVTLEMEAGPGPLVLEMPDIFGNGLAAGLSSHVEGERASDSSGQELEVERNGSSWTIDHRGWLNFTYKVRMGGYETGTSYLDNLADAGPPWPFFPLLEEDLAYLPGYAVFVRPSGSEYLPQLELKMPQAWQRVLPWSAQPSGMDELLGSPIYAGELSLYEQGSLVVAAPESSPAAAGDSLPEYGGKARALLEKAESLLGGLGLEEGDRLVLALLFRGEGGAAPAKPYPSTPFPGCVVIPGPSRGDPLADATIAATARGMASLLLARGLEVDTEASWLREGSAWYFQDLLPHEAGLWGSGLFWDRFNLGYNAYREARARSTDAIAQAGALGFKSGDAAVLLTRGGATLCASIDSELRSMQPYSLDLFSLLRSLFELGGAGKPLSNADIQSALAGLTGRDWSAFFRDYVEGTVEIPASAFSSLNILGGGGSSLPSAEPETDTSTSDWVLIGIAVLVVFIIPFVLEPYTMRPRKPGFLEKQLAKDEDD